MNSRKSSSFFVRITVLLCVYVSGCADIFFFHGAFLLIGHFTVMGGSEADGDLVLIQTFLLYYVIQVVLMLTSIFQEQFP